MAGLPWPVATAMAGRWHRSSSERWGQAPTVDQLAPRRRRTFTREFLDTGDFYVVGILLTATGIGYALVRCFDRGVMQL